MAYLTRSGIKKQVKFASDLARPDPKPIVKEIELYNEFNKRNPRQDLAGGGMLVQPGFGGTRQGYATSKTKTNKFKYKITNQHGTFYSDKKPKSSAKEVGSGKFSMAERNRATRIKYPEYSSYAEHLKKEPATVGPDISTVLSCMSSDNFKSVVPISYLNLLSAGST